ncbi:MAG TPA: L-threonylcarbamoyladenylate synthase [Gemmatimonadaceae bacterium]|nr:L-threonylcarbamoyladenylate synthase [Gemmatimonadaceae bacterium]
MRRVEIDPGAPQAAIIREAAAVLREGGLVAFPTETVYGLGANALDAGAVDRIYAAKGRPSYNPLIVHLAHASEASNVVATWPDVAQRLATSFWPGPLTMVLPKRANVPDSVSAGLRTVGIRVPRHPVAHALLAAAAIPVAAPSANRSMQVSPTTAAHVMKSLGDADGLVLDGGPTPVGIESTVIDLSGLVPTLLRPGTISLPELERVVGAIEVASPSSGTAARKAPGMLDKHYAPRARVILVSADDAGVRLEHERASVRRAGAMVIRADVEPAQTVIRMPDTAPAYAARLYETLHSLDDMQCDVIVIERVPGAAEWMGIADRLERAAR